MHLIAVCTNLKGERPFIAWYNPTTHSTSILAVPKGFFILTGVGWKDEESALL